MTSFGKVAEYARHRRRRDFKLIASKGGRKEDIARKSSLNYFTHFKKIVGIIRPNNIF